MLIAHRRNPVARAFTLVELIAVVVVLAILAGIAVPKFFDYTEKAKESATRTTLKVVRTSVANFYANSTLTGTAAYPTLLQMQTLGTVLQEPIPANPYNNSATIALGTWIDPTPQNPIPAQPVSGTAGWNYDPVKGRFWCNSNTANVGENSW